MADDDSTPPSDDSVSESKVREIVASALAGLKPGSKTAPKETPEDIAQQVRDELANVDRKKTSEQKAADLEARLRAVEEASAPAEKPPQLFRRIERLMGWRIEDE